MWLVKKSGNSKAHIWTGEDTACRMASTGGIKVKRYELTEDRAGREICHMCESVATVQGITVKTGRR